MGGSFGGKATRSPWLAVAAAIGTKLTNGRTCSMHMTMADCMSIFGGRSIYRSDYRAAFDSVTGKCVAVDVKVKSTHL